jgi:hypothetical protein
LGLLKKVLYWPNLFSINQYPFSFLGQNEIRSDLMSCQLVGVRVNISLKIFSETIIPRKLIFGSNVPWVGLFKICLNGSEIPNIFQTGSEKPQKLAEYL